MQEGEEGRSLPETPTWSVATVITAIIAISFIIQNCISRLKKVNGFFFFFPSFFNPISTQFAHGDSDSWVLIQMGFCLQWLMRTERMALLAALEEIVKGEELIFISL